MEGSARFGLWFVYIRWDSDNVVSRIRFVRQSVSGPVPLSLSQYLAGKTTTLSPLSSLHEQDDTVFGRIYREVKTIPYERREHTRRLQSQLEQGHGWLEWL